MRTRLAALAIGLWFGAVNPLGALDTMPYCAEDGFTWGFGPTLVPASNFGDRFGLRANAAWCTAGHDQTKDFPFSYGLHAGAHYLLVDKSVQIPDATEVRASGALSVSISKPERRAPRNIHPDSLRTWDGGGFNAGFLDVGATVGYEANANRREQNVALGFEGRYALNASGWARLVPSIVARFEWVEPTSSQVRDAAGIPENSDGHKRWSLRGYWNTSLDFFSDRLRDLRLQVDASVFRARGLEQVLVDAGWRDGEHAGVTLRFNRRFALPGPLALTSIYGRYSGGQLPTDSTGRNAFSAGIEITND